MAPPLGVAWMALRQLRRIQAGPIIYNHNRYPIGKIYMSTAQTFFVALFINGAKEMF